MDDKTNSKLNKANRVFKGTLKQTLSHLKADSKNFLLTEDSNELLGTLESKNPDSSFILISPLKTSFSIKDEKQLSEDEILMTTHRCEPGALLNSISKCPVLQQSQFISIIDTTDPIACSHYSEIVRRLYHKGCSASHVTETRFYSLVTEFDVKKSKEELSTILSGLSKKYALEQNTQKNLDQFANFAKGFARSIDKLTFCSDGHSITCTIEGPEKSAKNWSHKTIKAIAGKICTNSIAFFCSNGHIRVEAKLPIAKMHYSTFPSAIIIMRQIRRQKKVLPSAG